MHFTLEGQPKSTQHCYKYTCMGGRPRGYMDKGCKDLKEDYQWQLKSQYHGEPLQGDLEMEVHLFFGTKRKADIDNYNKLLLDAMSGIVYEDDIQLCKLTIFKGYDKERPRIEVVIHKQKK